MQTINRTYYPKYTTYTGDGSGRDGYVVFGNGGLHELRNYEGSKPREPFINTKSMPRTRVAPKKDATAFDYVPDGSGRDSYIIFNFGLKANYQSSFREFERDLRTTQPTPHMDARIAAMNDKSGTTVASFRNWPSPQAREYNRKLLNQQRASIERLSQSPPRHHRTNQHSREKLEDSVASISKPQFGTIEALGATIHQNNATDRSGKVVQTTKTEREPTDVVIKQRRRGSINTELIKQTLRARRATLNAET